MFFRKLSRTCKRIKIKELQIKKAKLLKVENKDKREIEKPELNLTCINSLIL